MEWMLLQTECATANKYTLLESLQSLACLYALLWSILVSLLTYFLHVTQ